MTNLPERFDLASQDPLAHRVDAMRSLFPDIFREDKLDPEALLRTLGYWAETGPERFGLNWPGKAECMRLIQEPSIGTLVPMREESVQFDSTQNVIIEGDNLEVLKLLQKAYYGKVKLIYIDPPYNTGKEFIYPDNFKEGLTDYLKYSGQVDDEGLKLSANAETDGRYHSKWLSMLYPRLFLARNLLTEDGVIFVSIDDHEVHNLRSLMNEVFGEENFIAAFIWQHSVQPKGYTDTVSLHHNTIMCFQRSESFELAPLDRTEEHNKNYSNPDDDPRGDWRTGDVRNSLYRPNLRYTLTTPSGKVIDPPENGWRWSKQTMQAKMEDGEIIFSSDESRIIRKIYLSTVEGRAAESIWFGKDVGTTRDGVGELKRLFGGTTPFDTPKPVELIRRMLKVGGVESDDIVLDFFAGSGTTAHAVLAENAADGGRRRFLAVQLPEPTELADYPTIAAITRERVRRAGTELLGGPKQLGASDIDCGFRSYSLAPSNFSIWNSEANDVSSMAHQLQLSVDHVVSGGSEASILAELLLKAGYLLTSPSERLNLGGLDVYSIAEGALLICLAPALSIDVFEAMVELDPVMVLVLDASFGGSDELKVNALQTVRARNKMSGSDIVMRVV